MKDFLETFENPQKKDDYLIKMDIPEFTCICPLTSQPDFAYIIIVIINSYANTLVVL